MNIYQYCGAMNVRLQCVYNPITNTWVTNFHDEDGIYIQIDSTTQGPVTSGSSNLIDDSINKFSKIISGKRLNIKGAVFLVPSLI